MPTQLLRNLSLAAFAALLLVLLSFGPGVPPAVAHRDGCHRWHSCPSDTGSYVCGDLGYASECYGLEDDPLDEPDDELGIPDDDYGLDDPDGLRPDDGLGEDPLPDTGGDGLGEGPDDYIDPPE